MDPAYDYSLLVHPFTCVIAGPSKSGKTNLLTEIISKNERLIRPRIGRIVYCFSVWQPEFEKLEKKHGVEFHQGMCDVSVLRSDENNLIIYDDLMDECAVDKSILDLFTKGSHHMNISVIVLTQNVFSKGKNNRTISLNTQYLILFNNPRDRSQIGFMARQMYPEAPRFLQDAYRDAATRPHGYIFVDNNQQTPEELRVQSNITARVRTVYNKK